MLLHAVWFNWDNIKIWGNETQIKLLLELMLPKEGFETRAWLVESWRDIFLLHFRRHPAVPPSSNPASFGTFPAFLIKGRIMLRSPWSEGQILVTMTKMLQQN